MLKSVLLFFIISVCCGSLSAQSNCPGKVVGITGQGTATENGREIRISSQNYTRIKLYSGLIVNAIGKGSELKLELDCVNGQVIVSPSRPYKIPGTPKAASGTKPGSKIWKRGGGYRAGSSIILFPIESSEIVDVLRPETVVLRW